MQAGKASGKPVKRGTKWRVNKTGICRSGSR
jgi:hypothetical protein